MIGAMIGRVLFAVLLSFALVVQRCVATAGVIREYNFVKIVSLSSLGELTAQYLDAEQRVRENVFLGVASADCWALMSSPAFEGAARYAQNLHAVTLPFGNEGFPVALRDCAEVFFYRTGDALSAPRARTTDFGDVEFTQWAKETMRVETLTFRNAFSFPIAIFWHEEALEPVLQGQLAPGESFAISAFLGHLFTASALTDEVADHPEHPVAQYNTASYSRIVDYMAVDGDEYEFSPFNRLETCEVEPGDVLYFVEQSVPCDNMLLRFLEFSHSEWHIKRLGLNYVQPKLVRGYSAHGFEHRKLPAETYTWLKDWYEREQRRIEESESSAGPCMNQHVAPSTITHLDAEGKARLQRELQPILEAWYGGPLFLTSIYGIRKYTNGSVLRMHVDTATTHVVSAIINVDQSVEEDWPLLILDHDDNEHELVMEAGDMVLYESAKALHGRPKAFKGEHYDNIFIHFQPVEGWDYEWI